jgi:hypothetical protein
LDNTPPKVAKIIRTIEAACAQLSCTVGSPGHVMLNVRKARELCSYPSDAIVKLSQKCYGVRTRVTHLHEY